MTTSDHAAERAVDRQSGAPRRSSWLLGVPVDDVTLDETIDIVFELVRDGREQARTHQVATVNVDFVINAQSDPRQRDILRRTALSIPDGMPIVWGSGLLRTPLRERVAGADLVPGLAERAAREGARLALLGAAPGVAEEAARRLRSSYPGLQVVADAGPMFSSLAELSLDDLGAIVSFEPDICCVAFGNPKQELFIDYFGPSLGVPVMIGVGGSLDFLVGVKRRAPGWMQSTGLEWVHRAATEPRRLAGRYLRDAVRFGPALVQQMWRGRGSAAAPVPVRDEDGTLVVDVSRVERLDNRTVADLVSAVRDARLHGRPIDVIGDPASVGGVDGVAEFLLGSSSPGRADRIIRRTS